MTVYTDILEPYKSLIGMFLLRHSARTPGGKCLAVCNGSSIVHYRIDVFPSGKYGIQDGLHHATLEDLVQHYMKDKDGLCTRSVMLLE